MEINRNEICTKLSEFFDSVKGDDGSHVILTEESRLDEYAINSIQFVQIVILIESEYNIEIPDEYLLVSEMNTIEKIIDIIISCITNMEKTR